MPFRTGLLLFAAALLLSACGSDTVSGAWEESDTTPDGLRRDVYVFRVAEDPRPGPTWRNVTFTLASGDVLASLSLLMNARVEAGEKADRLLQLTETGLNPVVSMPLQPGDYKVVTTVPPGTSAPYVITAVGITGPLRQQHWYNAESMGNDADVGGAVLALALLSAVGFIGFQLGKPRRGTPAGTGTAGTDTASSGTASTDTASTGTASTGTAGTGTASSGTASTDTGVQPPGPLSSGRTLAFGCAASIAVALGVLSLFVNAFGMTANAMDVITSSMGIRGVAALLFWLGLFAVVFVVPLRVATPKPRPAA